MIFISLSSIPLPFKGGLLQRFLLSLSQLFVSERLYISLNPFLNPTFGTVVSLLTLGSLLIPVPASSRLIVGMISLLITCSYLLFFHAYFAAAGSTPLIGKFDVYLLHVNLVLRSFYYSSILMCFGHTCYLIYPPSCFGDSIY